MRTFVISSKLTAYGAVLLALTLVAMAWTVSGQQIKRSSVSDAPRIRATAPAGAAALAARQRFLEMFARAYFPGRTGQLLVVPREGDFITRPDPAKLDTDFLVYVLRGPAVRDQIAIRQAQTCQQFLALRDIRNLKAPVPPLPEQRRIVAELDGLQAEVDALKRLQAETATELDALLPSVLDKAFKGEL